jgi:hypothetical protein
LQCPAPEDHGDVAQGGGAGGVRDPSERACSRLVLNQPTHSTIASSHPVGDALTSGRPATPAFVKQRARMPRSPHTRPGRAAVVSADADVTPALSRGCERQARQGTAPGPRPRRSSAEALMACPLPRRSMSGYFDGIAGLRSHMSRQELTRLGRWGLSRPRVPRKQRDRFSLHGSGVRPSRSIGLPFVGPDLVAAPRATRRAR